MYRASLFKLILLTYVCIFRKVVCPPSGEKTCPSVVSRIMEKVVNHNGSLAINFTGKGGKPAFRNLRLWQNIVGK
jgi:hypothetical protein